MSKNLSISTGEPGGTSGSSKPLTTNTTGEKTMRDIPNGSGGTMSDPPKKTVSTSDDKSGVGTTNEDAVTASSPSIAIAKCNMDTTSKISIAPDPVSNSLFGLSDNSLAIPELSKACLSLRIQAGSFYTFLLDIPQKN